jgi:hypothetical protein
MICRRTPWLIVALLVVIVASAIPRAVSAATSVDHGGAYFGSVVVEPGETVEGDLTVFFGNATVEGTVDGDVNVIGGSIYLNGGDIEGRTHAVGGSVVQTIVPWAPTDDAIATGTHFQPDHRIVWRIAWDIVALVVFLIFPLRSRLALDRLEQHPGMATLAGLCAWVAVIPIAILLLVTIVLIPLIPVEFVLLTVAIFIGKAALSLLVGRRFYELLHPQSTPAPLAALVLGLVLLTAAELVPVLGVLVTLMIALVGVGSVLLTFVPDWNMPQGPGAPPPPNRRVIGGPPMPVR